MSPSDPTKRKRRRTTVGSIVVPELPWQRESDTREDDPPRPGLDYCDQVDCDCADPFHCT